MIKQMNVKKQKTNKPPVLGSNPSRLKSKFVRFKKSDDGVAAIEFALIGPFFFALLFAIIDVAVYFMFERAAEASSDMLSRRIKTGIIAAGIDEAGLRNELCDIPTMSLFDCDSVVMDVRVVSRFESPGDMPRQPDGSLNSAGFGVSVGGSRQIHIVRIFVPWPSVLPWSGMMSVLTGVDQSDSNVDGQRMIVSSTAFLKE